MAMYCVLPDPFSIFLRGVSEYETNVMFGYKTYLEERSYIA